MLTQFTLHDPPPLPLPPPIRYGTLLLTQHICCRHVGGGSPCIRTRPWETQRTSRSATSPRCRLRCAGRRRPWPSRSAPCVVAPAAPLSSPPQNPPCFQLTRYKRCYGYETWVHDLSKPDLAPSTEFREAR